MCLTLVVLQVSTTCRLLCGAAEDVLASCTSIQVVDWKKEPDFWDTDILLDWAPSIVNLRVKGAQLQVCFDFFLKAATSLETLAVDFEVGCDGIDLGWLRGAGPKVQFGLNLVLSSHQPRDHELVVAQLLDLSITNLTLYMGNGITADGQEAWEKLHVTDSLMVELWELDKFVYALPSCPVLKIFAQEEISERHAPLDVRWKAITRHAGSVEIDCSLTLGLEVSGHPHESPGPGIYDLGGPWRLRVNDAIFTWGLPRSEPCANAYFLRNAAALAAGWDDGAEPGREYQVPSEYDRYMAIEYMHE